MLGKVLGTDGEGRRRSKRRGVSAKPCIGDSGSPLVVTGGPRGGRAMLVGLAVTGDPGCGKDPESEEPLGFVRVGGEVAGWIREIMGTKCN